MKRSYPSESFIAELYRIYFYTCAVWVGANGFEDTQKCFLIRLAVFPHRLCPKHPFEVFADAEYSQRLLETPIHGRKTKRRYARARGEGDLDDGHGCVGVE